MSWVAVAGAAVTAGGAYLNSQNKPKAITPPPIADPRAPGGVTTAQGGGFYVDPRTGRTVFASGQGGGGGRTLDSYRDRMLMDMVMGGGDSVGLDIENQIKEAQARLDRYKSGSGSIKALNIGDYVGNEWVDAQGGFKDPSKINVAEEMSSNSDLFKRFMSDTKGGDYGKGSLQEKFTRWTQDAYKNGVQKSKEKYDNDMKTQGGNEALNTEEQAAAQRQLDELLGIQGQLGGMRESLASNPLLKMMSEQTGRRARGGAPGGPAGGGEGFPGGGGGPMPVPGQGGGPTSQIPGAQNYDQAFSDPRKAGMDALSAEYLAKAGKDRDFMGGVSKTWANPTDADLGPEGASLLDRLKVSRPGVMSSEKIQAPTLNTDGLGSFQQYLRNQATSQFEQQDQLDRERIAAMGGGGGSQSAIAGLARRRQLTDALTGADAQVFGIGQNLRDKNWDQRLGAASHNLAVDKANQDYSLDYDRGTTSTALALSGLRDSAFRRGLDATKLNADLQGLDWAKGMDAFGTVTGLDQRDIDNNFRNETLGMAQDQASMDNRMRVMDWLSGRDNLRFQQDQIRRQADLGEMQFGAGIGGNYLQQMLEAELARAGMQSSADQANAQIQSGSNAALMQLLGTMGSGVVSGIGSYQAGKAKAGKTG